MSVMLDRDIGLGEGLTAKDRLLKEALWQAARRLARKLQAIRDAGYSIFDGQELLTERDVIVIDELDKRVGISSGRCFTSIFDWYSWDYESVRELEKHVADTFIVVKVLKNWPKPCDVARAKFRKDQREGK